MTEPENPAKNVKQSPKRLNWQDVDKIVNQAYRDGRIHEKTFDNTPKAAIRAITFNGELHKKPNGFSEWENYSNELLNRFNLIIDGSEIPNWNNLLFRLEDDFKSGTFGLYPSI